MTSNLIQNYISNKPAAAYSQQRQNRSALQTPQKPKPDFDIQKELDNRTFIKPLEGKGRLLKNNIFNAPAIMVKDIIYDAKALKHAVSGKANDHELGKLNDFGLLLGGLGIAGYLFTRKQTPKTKGMEFIGLASFLASMAIWPKIAIQLPAYLIHGVNVQKEYEDSFGRKKPFYQDPQFLPWDLYTEEEINKMGDRMGVPKDIPNRREFIQEKMKKIGIQNNTLWMLTAGFATPIMSGLICNMAEPYLQKYLDNKNNKKADSILNNLAKYAETKYKDIGVEQDLIKLLDSNQNKPLTEELKESIISTITKYMDPVTADNFKADIKEQVFGKETYKLEDTKIQNILTNLKEVFQNKIPRVDAEFLQAAIPDEQSLINALKNEGLFGTDIKQIKFGKILDTIRNCIDKNVRTYNEAHPDKRQNLGYIRKLIMTNMTQERNSNHVSIVLSDTVSNVLDTPAINKLKTIVKLVDNFNRKVFALDEYALRKVGAAPETVIANYWNDTAKEFVKLLGFTDKEIAMTKNDRTLVGALLREKIENIVADTTAYNNLMEKLIKKIAEINAKINKKDLAAPLLTGNAENTAYTRKVDTIFDDFAAALREQNIGFVRTAQAIAGRDKNDTVGTAKNIQKAYVTERLLGVKSSFYRIINALDYFRRVATTINSSTVLQGRYTEHKEELIELCKIITLEGHSSDFATKFYMLRNPNPDRSQGNVEVKNGKVVNRYLGQTAELTDIPGDQHFYKDAMRLMFENEMSPDTLKLLEQLGLKDEVLKYRQIVLEHLGGEYYFAKPFHLLGEKTTMGSDTKFLITGNAIDELVHKTFQQRYNNKKWFKIFGGFGAGLLGVTILAQFFFGKMKTPERTGEKK